ncbi:MAG: sugar phosphate nucleotidyltransferase [Oscillospiraceae bacterium]
MKEISLVVMAAGMGSRFGGLKQMEPVGRGGEVIIDFSVYDAIKAGFNKVVFIIKKENEEEFKCAVGNRISKKIKTEYVFQSIPSNRKKPYGTGEAILCCKDVISGPFAVINADDFYGAGAYKTIYDFLSQSDECAMVGYKLENTLTENGTVARGVCNIENGYLTDVTEYTSIPKDNDLPKDTIVSMNLWGLQSNIFDEIENQFNNFKKNANIDKDEFFIPSVIDLMIKSKKAKVRVLTSQDKWYGVTYKEDKPQLVNAISNLVDGGLYNGI